jgi:serine/threonine protein kinase
MAVVFRARDERLDRTVALKLLAPALAGNRELQQRFISESRAAAAIDDAHIVPVFSAGEADGLLYIAMRYVARAATCRRSWRCVPGTPAARRSRCRSSSTR